MNKFNHSNSQPHNKKVQWDETTESYKVISNPEWDIEQEIAIYSTLRNKGIDDRLATDVLAVFNSTRPVYRCYCYDGHRDVGYTFNPCPCYDCEQKGKADGFDISEPADHLNLHKNNVKVVGSMVKQKLFEINNVVAVDNIVISPNDLEVFQSFLIEYGKSDLSWSEIVDLHESFDDDFYVIVSILEYFWIAFVLNNPQITGHRFEI